MKVFKSAAVAAMLIASLFTGAANAGTFAKTKYPIVLVHGLFGYGDILGADYFYTIPQRLTRNGATVFVAEVSPANSSEVRGEQLLTYVDEVLALTGAQKVNLIGHSHGSPTSRYVASVAPQKVASVTSVGGVNWGSKTADQLRETLEEGSLGEAGVGLAVNAFVELIELASGSDPRDKPTDSLAALNSLTTEGSIAFNKKYPEGVPSAYCRNDGKKNAENGVVYFSWSGGVTLTNILDPVDVPLTVTGLEYGEPNDGLVASCSTHLGQVLKDNYRMNHMDEVNQTMGITSWFETSPVAVFLSHAHRLKRHGL